MENYNSKNFWNNDIYKKYRAIPFVLINYEISANYHVKLPDAKTLNKFSTLFTPISLYTSPNPQNHPVPVFYLTINII